MGEHPEPIDFKKVRVYPLAERKSLSAIERIVVDPDQPTPACQPEALAAIHDCARSDGQCFLVTEFKKGPPTEPR